MDIKKILTFILILIVIVSCEENDESSLFEDVPVIEAYLQANNIFEMTVERQIPFADEVDYSSDDIDNLDITITCDDGEFTLTPVGDGKYVDSSLIISTGTQYVLSFTFNDQEVSAITQIPSVPDSTEQSVTTINIEQMDDETMFQGGIDMPDPVEIEWYNDDESYYLVVVENIEDDPESIVELDDDDDRPEMQFRNEPTQGSGVSIQARSFSYYGTHRIVLYHLNADYATLYDDEETTSQNLTTPITSIENGVGIFTGANSDTLWLEVYE